MVVKPGKYKKHASYKFENGNLKKAIPSTKEVQTPYDFTTKEPSFEGYTGDDAKKGQISVVKRAIEHSSPTNKNTKNMINPITGKNELHILTHRGIKNIDSEATGPNMLSVGPEHVEQSHHAVHTLDPQVAEQYGNRHSFWVPISNMVGTSKYINGRFKNSNDFQPSNEDLSNALEAMKVHNQRYQDYAGQHPDAQSPKDVSPASIEQEARLDRANDPHADEQSHIVVKPGKYFKHQE
jgi:hypothetical protein